jgi:hypothetical protein
MSRRWRAGANSSARSPKPSGCACTTTAPSKPRSPEPTGTAESACCGAPRAARPSGRATNGKPQFLQLLRDAGLPEPKTNEPFHAPGYGHCEPDYHWPEHRVIVELDGFETHGTRAAFHADRAKDAALTASGHRVLRFTRDDEPAVAITRLLALLV